MRKILFGLFIAISYMANAALPVVNDSVLVEADEDMNLYAVFSITDNNCVEVQASSLKQSGRVAIAIPNTS